MTADLRQQLSSTLGTSYALDRELGGGGMSRVFVAEETALGRKVVVKVLQPELAAAVSLERFHREIQLAANLQHPNIVPVLSAGVAAGLPYYTMPYVEGESLRLRLAREGPLDVPEAVRILRDVASALSYSHERGVVHRDIKPDNVLLARHHALVTDFGVAKALSASADGRSGMLTTLGLAMGTPAYMAPEQAAADPNTDHRADIYALGALAYEMLTGVPLFGARSPSALLAAQVTEQPAPIDARRPGLPPALASLVMRCLAKDPGARPQSAEEVLALLDQVATPAGIAAGAAPGSIPISTISLRRAVVIYAVALIAVVGVAAAATSALGLPDWVLPGAVVVMALILPVVALTALAHHAPVVTPAASAAWYPPTPYSPTGTAATTATTATAVTPTAAAGARPSRGLAAAARPWRSWLTWRRTTRGAAVAVLLFAAAVALHMTLRAHGIGPAGTLVGKGVIDERDPVLVADFATAGGDTTLGDIVTEALRTDLLQSRVVTVVQPSAVRAALLRMQRSPDTPLAAPVAREVAAREGIKAVVEGEVSPLGGGYVLTARLVSPAKGDVLAAFRETASEQGELIAAIDRLSHDLREKAGESLKSIRADLPLENVTTPSLEALRRYTQGVRALELDQDIPRGTALLEEAIRLDSNFAMAYRKLGVAYQRMGDQPTRQVELFQKAYDLRDRLPDSERYLTVGTYFGFGPHFDPPKALAAYDALLELDPKNGPALNNAALVYEFTRDFRRAAEYLRRAADAQPGSATFLGNLVDVQLNSGQVAEARRTIEDAKRRFPNTLAVQKDEALLAVVSGDYDAAERLVRALRDSRPDDPAVRSMTPDVLAAIAIVRGRLAAGERHLDEKAAVSRERNVPGSVLTTAAVRALLDVWFRSDTTRALTRLDSALRATPLATIPELERPYLDVADAYALAGRPARARALLADFDRSGLGAMGPDMTAKRSTTAGAIALAERRYDEAVRAFRAADVGPCVACALAPLAIAYDRAGSPDSAVAIYERYLANPSGERAFSDPYFLAGVHKRLGELYEARNDDERAVLHYERFIDLWRDADPELRPQVDAVRARILDLRPTEGRRRGRRV